MAFQKLKICLLAGLVLFLSAAAYSQSPATFGGLRPTIKFDHFTTEDGLGHNNVTCMLQDRTGFLWVGTLGGLRRYDGYEFRPVGYAPDESSGFSHPEIQNLLEDAEGNLWVGLQRGGLNRIKRNADGSARYIRYRPEAGNEGSLNHNVVNAIRGDPSGALWIGTNGGLDLFDPETGNAIQYTHQPHDENSLSHPHVRKLLESRNGALWVGTLYGLNRLVLQEQLGTKKKITVISRFLSCSENPGTVSNNVIQALHEDANHRLWIGTTDGLTALDPETGIRAEYRHNPNEPGSLGYSSVWSIHEDRLLRLWIGTAHTLDRLAPDRKTFVYYDPYGNSGGYGVNGLLEDFKGSLWFSGSRGLVRFDPRTEVFRHYDVSDGLQSNNFTNAHFKNNDGIWNEVGASLKIEIVPPWWRTRGMYALYLLLIAASFYGIRRHEMGRIQLRNELKIKNAEAEKLHEVDRMKSRFFASISHEFRTPLTLILGPVEKWLGAMQQSEMKSDFHMVCRNARRLRQLIDQLLDLSKLEAGKMQLQSRTENVVALARMTTMAFESLAKQLGISLHFLAIEERILACVDRDKLEKIVTNLLSNAFKFSDTGGEIQVMVSEHHRNGYNAEPARVQPAKKWSHKSRDGNFVQIRICDTGVGIPADDLEKIFDHFRQATAGAVRGGTGIGLALVKELVEVHGGTISVESKDGKGASFSVFLPVGKVVERVEEPPAVAPVFVHDKPSGQNGGQNPAAAALPGTKNDCLQTILIVEDNPDMRAYIRGCIEGCYRIVEAEDGERGMKQAHNQPPDLVISDVLMPEMNGFALCKSLKSDVRTSHIPVILLTARASAESKLEGLEIGADDYLTKPFDANELRARVRNLIEQRNKLRERFRRELIVQPSEVTATSMDEAFLARIMEAVETHIDDPSYTTDELARVSGVGRRQLNRKLRALTGQSVREFIRTVRLKRAAHLLQKQTGTVTEIAYEVGFNSIAHFAKIFREEFGMAPSEYRSGDG